MYQPDKEKASKLAKELLELFAASRDKKNDPEGRTATLGATIFFGMVLACISDVENREMMCDAAVGYSFQTDGFLEMEEGGHA
jgi:hypothetical protein